MTSNVYHFVTQWRLQGTVEEVGAIIADANGLSRWWPAVYLDVQVLDVGDANGVGAVIRLYTKGWLPYTLRWQFQVTEVEHLRRLVIRAEGDFVGRGIWTFAQDGDWVNVTYDWQIEAQKPLLRRLSFLFKPLFAANHEWAMRMGEESIRLELARRRASTATERARIPPPPAPTPASLADWMKMVLLSMPGQQRQGKEIINNRST